MTLESVYLLIYDDQEGGGDIYHRVFADSRSAEKALAEIKAEVLEHNVLSDADKEEYEMKCDYADEPRYFYLVDSASIEVSKHTLEGSQ